MTFSLTDTVRDALTSGGIVNGAASALGIAKRLGVEGPGRRGLGHARRSGQQSPRSAGARRVLQHGPGSRAQRARRSTTPRVTARRRGRGHPRATSAAVCLAGSVRRSDRTRRRRRPRPSRRHRQQLPPPSRLMSHGRARGACGQVGGLVRGGALTVGSLGQALLGSQSEDRRAPCRPSMAGNLINRAQICGVVREARPQSATTVAAALTRASQVKPSGLVEGHPLTLLLARCSPGGSSTAAARRSIQVDTTASR